MLDLFGPGPCSCSNYYYSCTRPADDSHSELLCRGRRSVFLVHISGASTTAIMPGNFKSLPLDQLSEWPTPNYVNPPRRTWLTGARDSVQLIGRTTDLHRRIFYHLTSHQHNTGRNTIMASSK